MRIKIPKLRWVIAILLFLATTLNYGDRLTLSVVTRFSYSPIFMITGLMHPLSIVLLYRLVPDRYFARRV